MDLNKEKMKSDLEEYADKTKFQLHFKPSAECRLSIKETDNLVDITINPHRIRSQQQLDHVIIDCQKALIWDRR